MLTCHLRASVEVSDFGTIEVRRNVGQNIFLDLSDDNGGTEFELSEAEAIHLAAALQHVGVFAP